LVSPPGFVWATHVPDRKDSELAESVSVYERGEQALSELPVGT